MAIEKAAHKKKATFLAEQWLVSVLASPRGFEPRFIP
jgi:hypothetical protein